MNQKWLSGLALLACISGLFTLSGCSICCDPFINDYMSTGGRVTRTNMTHGRVGSPFSEGQVMYEDQSEYIEGEYIEGEYITESEEEEGDFDTSYADFSPSDRLDEDDNPLPTVRMERPE